MAKRICFVVDSFISDQQATITGPMVQTYLIGKELRDRGWDVHYIAVSTSAIKEKIEYCENLTIHWVSRRQYLPLFDYKKIRTILRQVNADYHYQRGRDILTGFVARYCVERGSKFIWACAGDSGVELGKYQRQVQRRDIPILKKELLLMFAKLNDKLYEFGIQNATQVVVQTEYQKKRLKDIFNIEANIIKSGHPKPLDIERGERFRVLWIGSIKEVKKPEIFIELARISSDLNCEFVMAGQTVDKELETRIHTQSKQLKNMTYLGRVPFHQSQALIGSAHVLVNTTDACYEGLSNAFVQAWLGGTVTISIHSDPDGVIEKFNLGAKLDSIHSIRDAIEKMILDPVCWKRMSDNARAFGLENFLIHKITDDILKVLEK